MLDVSGKILKKKYTIASIFTLKQLVDLLKEIIYDDELVLIAGDGHITGLFKHGKYYYFYNSDDRLGEYKESSIEKIAEAIENSLIVGKTLILSLQIFSFEDNNHAYPKQKEILIKTNQDFDMRTMFYSSQLSIGIGSLESLRFYLDHGLDPNTTHGHGNSMLSTALINKENDILRELLKRGADPNQTYDHYDYFDNILENLGQKINIMPIAAAAKRGDIEAVKILLADSRTDVSLTSGPDKKTALIYAEESGHHEIADLIRNHGKDCTAANTTQP